MPQAANIIVKRNDGTTDVTYTLLTPSAGDKVAARWRSNSVSGVASFRPELAMKSEAAANGATRRCVLSFILPNLVTVNGETVRKGQFSMSVTAIVPLDMDDTQVAEGVSQGVNLFASTLIKDSLKAGFAPT